MPSDLIALLLLQGQQSGPIRYISDRTFKFTHVIPRVDVYARNESSTSVISNLSRQANLRIAKTADFKGSAMSAAYINAPLDTILARHFSPATGSWTAISRPPYLIIDAFTANLGRVTLQARDRDLRDVLREWSRSVGLSYTVALDVQGKVSLTLKDEEGLTALRKILDTVDATYIAEGGIMNVVLPPAAAIDLNQVVTSFKCQGESLFLALQRLARRCDVAIEAGDDVDFLRRVSVDLSNQPLRVVLSELLGKGIRAEARGWRIFLSSAGSS